MWCVVAGLTDECPRLVRKGQTADCEGENTLPFDYISVKCQLSQGQNVNGSETEWNASPRSWVAKVPAVKTNFPYPRAIHVLPSWSRLTSLITVYESFKE